MIVLVQDQETHLPPEVGMMKDIVELEVVELEVVVVDMETIMDHHLPDIWAPSLVRQTSRMQHRMRTMAVGGQDQELVP